MSALPGHVSLGEICEINIMVDCKCSNDVRQIFSGMSQVLRLLALVGKCGSNNRHQGDIVLKGDWTLRAQNMLTILC